MTLEINDGSSHLAVLDAMSEAVLVVDGEGRIQFANAHAERTLAQPRAALAGRPLEAWLAAESRQGLRDDLERLLATPLAQPAPARRELFGLGDVTGRRAFELSLDRLGDVDPPRAVVVLRDVTERRRADERRAAASTRERAELERVEALIQFAPAFIIAIDREGLIRFINRTLPQYTREEVVGLSWLTFFPPAQHADMNAALQTVYATGSTQNFEVATAGPDGADVWFASQIAPIRQGEKIVGAVLVSQDVTEKKRAQTELLAGRHMAMLGTLAAGVAHEINTPIQYVGDSVQFLRGSTGELLSLLDKLQGFRAAALAGAPIDEAVRDAAEAEQDADLPYIRENVPLAFDNCVEGLNRVATIVRSLKEFAHPAEKSMVPADLNRAIESALTIATNEYRFVATLQMDLGELPPVTCHASEISQVVLNIVVNAAHTIGDVVKGTDRKGLITVRTRRDGDTALIAISDTGAGIPEAHRSRIFAPFFTTKEVGKGTGQGLAIAWSAVKERHGGELSFETVMGQGTTFFIRLPIVGRGA